MNKNTHKFTKKLKQISAIFTIVVIVLLYIVTLILAIMNNSYTKTFFEAALFASIFLPLILYIFIWLGNVLKSYNPNLEENKDIHKKTASSKDDNAENK